MSNKMTNYFLARYFILRQSLTAWRVSMENYFLHTAAELFSVGLIVGLLTAMARFSPGNDFASLFHGMLLTIVWTFGWGLGFGFGAILFHLIYSVCFPRKILLWLADKDTTGQAKMIARKRRAWE